MEGDTIAAVVILFLFLALLIVALVILAILFFLKLKKHHEEIYILKEELEDLRKFCIKLAPYNLSSTDEIKDFTQINEQDSSRPTSQRSGLGKLRYTTVFSSKVMNVHTTQSHGMEQLVKTAQMVYQEDSKDNLQFPVDEIDVTALVDRDEDVSAATKRLSAVEGRPTSYLIDTLSANSNVQHTNGIFVNKTVSTKGDVMTVSEIKLTIPPGAVERPTPISVGIVWEKRFRPNLTSSQALLSPLIVCQPSLKFSKPVTLTFPHSAHKVTSNWDWTVLKREGDIQSANDWIPITPADYSHKDINETHVSLALHHFTGFTLVGTSAQGKVAAKAVNMVAFTKPFQTGAMFKTKIYCISDYHYTSKLRDVKEEEKTLKRQQAESRVPLLVYQNGKHVFVDLTKYKEDEWQLDDDKDKRQMLDYQLIMHDLTPSCTYVLSPKGRPQKIVCEYSFQQQQSDSTSRLKIADEQTKVSPLPIVPLNEDPEGELQRQLILLLDVPADAGSSHGDWRNLALKLNLQNEEIAWLESRTSTESPTDALLKRLTETGKTYEDLNEILTDIEISQISQNVFK